VSTIAVYLLPVVIISNLALSLVVLLRGFKDRINRLFALQSLAVTVWSIAILGFYLLNSAGRVWIVFSHVSAASIAILFFYFASNFPKSLPFVGNRIRYYSALIPYILITGLLFGSKYIIGDVRGIDYEINSGYLLFSLYISVYFVFGYIFLIRQYLSYDDLLYKMQVKYVLIGSVLSSSLAMFTNLISPYAGVFSYTWLGPIFTFILVGSTAYAILKHNLFNIKVVATEILTFAIWIFLFVQITLADSVTQRVINTALLVMVVVFGVFLIRSVIKEVSHREQLQKLTGQLRQANSDLLLRNRYLAALQALTNEITRSLDFKKVTQEIVDGLSTKLDFVGGFLILLMPDNETLELTAITQSRLVKKAIGFLPQPLNSYKGNLKKDNTLITLAMRTGRVQIGTDMASFVSPPVPRGVMNIIQTVLRIRTIMAVPILSENKVMGCLVVTSRSQKTAIAESEIQMIKALGDEVGIVTRNLRLYEQLEHANTQLMSANKELSRLDKAKTEFLSIASHQLRTPLTAIKGYMSMVLAGDFGQVSEKQMEPLRDVSQSAERLIGLVNDLLDVSRIASGRLELHIQAVDLYKLVQDVIEEIRPKAEKKQVELVLDNKVLGQVLVKADPDKLRQVVINLIDNAIKYTAKGHVTISFSKNANMVRLAVKDSGIGISEEELPQLFHRFMRTREAQLVETEGTGLGLYVAKTIIEAQKGKIWAESEGLNKGSSFIFELPEAEAVKPESWQEVITLSPNEDTNG